MRYIEIPEHSIMGIRLFSACSEDVHRHINTEILYVLKGTLHLTFEKERKELKKESFVLIPAGRYHSVTAKEDTLFGCIHINRKAAGKYADFERICISASKTNEESFPAVKIRKLLSIIIRLYLMDDSSLNLLLNSRCYELLYYLGEYFGADREPAADSRPRYFAKIEKWITENCAEDVRLADMAKHLGLTTSYSSRYFRKIFGVNFLEYLTQVRLENVCRELVLYPDRNILRIAYDNGFTNMTSFHRMFRKKYGRSPGAYRNQPPGNIIPDNEADKRIYARVREYLKTESKSETEQFSDNRVTIACDLGKQMIYRKNRKIMVNAGRAAQLNSSDMQKHLLIIKKALKLKYIRIWGICEDDMIIPSREYREGYDYTKMDRIFDFLVDNGMHPYLDIGFKPKILLEDVWKPLMNEEEENPFKSAEDFGFFLEKFIDHYSRRYGNDELKNWYFEFRHDVRNKKAEYITEYMKYARSAGQVIKSKLSHARFGGPGEDPVSFLERIKKDDPKSLHDFPFDFITAYYFADDLSHGQKLDKPKHLFREEDYLPFWIERIRLGIKQAGIADLPVHITEWNLSVSNRNVLNDSCFNAAYLVKNIFSMTDNVKMVGIWEASDLFDEFNDSNTLLFGGAGILNRSGLKKPSFYALYFLSRLERCLIYRDEHTLITSNGAEDYYILCHNYCHPGYEYFRFDNNARTIPALFIGGTARSVSFELSNARKGKYIVKSRFVNSEAGNIQEAWVRIQELKDLSRSDLDYLEGAGTPKLETYIADASDCRIEFKFDLQPNEVRFVHVYFSDA